MATRQDNIVALYEDYRHVCTHVRSRRPGQRMPVAYHMPPEAPTFFARDKHWCCHRVAEAGPHCADLVSRLLSDRVAERLRAAQGVLALGSRHPHSR